VTLPASILVHAPTGPVSLAAEAPGAAEAWVEIDAAVYGPDEAALFRRHGGTFAPGGSAVGHVVAAGDAAAHLVGTRVLVGPGEACGECQRCRRGHPSLCTSAVVRGFHTHGTLASHVRAAARWLVPLDGVLAAAPIGPEAALLAREAPLVYELLARAGVGAGEATIWLGDPVLCELGSRIARAKGARAVILDGTQTGPGVALDATRTAGDPEPTDIKVFETSGDPEMRRIALTLAPDASTVGFSAVRLPTGDLAVPLREVMSRELTLFAVIAPHADLVPEVVALTVRGELDLGGLVPVVDRRPEQPTAIWTRPGG
jgi:L-iditol 2-dehydrogenase